MRTYIQQPGQVGVPGAPGNVGYLAQMPPMARLDGNMNMNMA